MKSQVFTVKSQSQNLSKLVKITSYFPKKKQKLKKNRKNQKKKKTIKKTKTPKSMEKSKKRPFLVAFFSWRLFVPRASPRGWARPLPRWVAPAEKWIKMEGSFLGKYRGNHLQMEKSSRNWAFNVKIFGKTSANGGFMNGLKLFWWKIPKPDGHETGKNHQSLAGWWFSSQCHEADFQDVCISWFSYCRWYSQHCRRLHHMKALALSNGTLRVACHVFRGRPAIWCSGPSRSTYSSNM